MAKPVKKVNHLDSNKALGRTDGWINSLTGLGDPNRDKRLSLDFEYDLYTQPDAEAMWRGDDMLARIVETIPSEMLREGFRVVVAGDRELSESMDKYLRGDGLAILDKCTEVLQYQRAYGGGAFLLGADDGQRDLTKPLDIDKLKSFSWMNVLTPIEVFPVTFYGDPTKPKYGEVELYRIQRQLYGGTTSAPIDDTLVTPIVHETRIIRFEGIRVSRRQLRERNGWGDSIFNRVAQICADFQAAWQAAGVMMQHFSQPVMKIAGLAEIISSQQSNLLADRMKAIDMARSVLKSIMIDKEDDFVTMQPHVQGLPEMLEKFALRLAAACSMPVSLLMGQAPSGLNATGDTEMRWFYDQVAAAQEKKLKPALLRICQLIFRSKTGPSKGKEPENWTIVFNPLWQMDEKDQANIRYLQAQADALYVQNGVLTPEEVALSRFGGDEYSTETKVDFDARDELKLEDMHANNTAKGQVPDESNDPNGNPNDTQKEADKGATPQPGKEPKAAVTVKVHVKGGTTDKSPDEKNQK